ncbi:hypothetical protein E1I18_00645 [Mycoplasmopsis mucosicanis]|uniref:Uncharacterized protein n=1 Tax=Mycoplasmopsis mucosicanis TaxID=458208 RepID=A0A507SQM9_9BACT|nr:hypothetical protein [Mycoplasmopsis mucosicanis]TQC54099.1 hypothetical protein E1I18_00645 [Mycoplasmopsis mucosicanis]
MEKKEALDIFTNILESTPGVYSIQCFQDHSTTPCQDCVVVKYNEMTQSWDFMAAITILKNSNLKNIVSSIGSLLKFELRNKNQKIGKLNILVGGLNND